MQTKDGTVTHETFREAWYKRSREILLSSGENVRESDKARLNPENYAKLRIWWRKFNRSLRALAAEHQRSGAGPLTDAELLKFMSSSNVRYLSGSKTGLFSDRRMLQEIRELALEYGRKHGGNFVRAVTESSDTAATLALLDDTASNQQAALRTEDDSEKPQGPGQAAVIASASTSLLDASVPSPAPGAGKAVRARQSRPSPLALISDHLEKDAQFQCKLTEAIELVARRRQPGGEQGRIEATQAFVAQELAYVIAWGCGPPGTPPPPSAYFSASGVEDAAEQKEIGEKARDLRLRLLRQCARVEYRGGDSSRVFASAFGAFVANIRNRIDINDVLTMLGNDLDVYDEIAREDEEPQPRRRQRVR